MMRIIAITVSAFLASATVALASPVSVTVSIAPALQKKAEQTLGVRDVKQLASQLKSIVEKRLAKTSAYDGSRIELVLADAQPNRPTFKQMSDKPGLSYQSFGIGGAEIEGRATDADGSVTPIAFKYYESDIRDSSRGGTWTDAEDTFEMFASSLSRGHAKSHR